MANSGRPHHTATATNVETGSVCSVFSNSAVFSANIIISTVPALRQTYLPHSTQGLFGIFFSK
jgi:hypothetical protein